MRSAFRNLGMRKDQFFLLVMKARSPFDRQMYYFVDKRLPFGASISCAHFQNFSDAIAHIMKVRTRRNLVNYLDNFLFAAFLKAMCDKQIRQFLDLCAEINFPVSLEKTHWGGPVMVFLGLLIDAVRRVVCVPPEKIEKALESIQFMMNSRNYKVTFKQVQQLCGLLNFIGRAIVPGRTFTRRLYIITGSRHGAKKLLPHHHIRLTKENRLDLELWMHFLRHPSAYCRPFMDFLKEWSADEISFYTHSSRNKLLGCGGICGSNWFYTQWDKQFIEQAEPSIAYLELYALTAGFLLYGHQFANQRIKVHCDNQSVVDMVNISSSSCKNCMVLIRIIVLHSMINNVRIKAVYVRSKQNGIADALSRLQMTSFRELTKNMEMKKCCDCIPEQLCPMRKLWL